MKLELCKLAAGSGRCTKWPRPDTRANHALQLPTRAEGDALFYVWESP